MAKKGGSKHDGGGGKSPVQKQQKQQPAASTGAPATTTAVATDANGKPLPASLIADSKFFSNLVQLVPAHFLADPAAEKLELQYMKKRERAAAKAMLRAQGKANKRAKLDPSANGARAKQQGDDAESDSSDDEADGEENGKQQKQRGGSSGGGPGRLTLNLEPGAGPSRDDLRERLQKRLETMRAQRHADERQRTAEKARQWASKQQGKHKQASAPAAAQQQGKGGAQKRKRGDAAEAQPTANGSGSPAPGPKGAASKQQQQRKGGAAAAAAAAAVPASPAKGGLAKDVHDLAFGTIELGSNGVGFGAGRDKKGGKQQRKKSKAALLKEAEAKAAQRAELEATPGGKEALQQQAWQAALTKASGERVLDDPRLLRRSIKKDRKLKEKKARAWQERERSQKQDVAARQKKRTDNLQARSDKKVEKKKARREKRLMRAGFEGRRDTAINSGGA